MDIRRRVGLAVQRHRKAKGWSQEELADQAGLHRTYVSGVERGVRNPTVTVLEKLAGALSARIGDLTDYGRLLTHRERSESLLPDPADFEPEVSRPSGDLGA